MLTMTTVDVCAIVGEQPMQDETWVNSAAPQVAAQLGTLGGGNHFLEVCAFLAAHHGSAALVKDANSVYLRNGNRQHIAFISHNDICCSLFAVHCEVCVQSGGHCVPALCCTRFDSFDRITQDLDTMRC